MRTLPFIVVAAVSVAARIAAAAPSYEQDVVPILRTYCSGCHNDADKEGELSVERFASLRRGGAESGDPVAPGDPAASVMIRRIRSAAGDHMPPVDEPQPTASEVATLEAWIAAGAPGPRLDSSILSSLVAPKLPPHVGPKPVTAAAVSPDGARVAVARGRELVLVDAASLGAAPSQPLPIADLPGRVMAVHFSRDGRLLVIAGGIAGLSGVAQIRDAATGAVIREFTGHRDLLHDAELSPDGTLLATAGYDRSVKLWNVADGGLMRSIDVHTGAVFDLAWHPGGRLLASASADETVKLWRVPDGVRLDTLNQPQGEVFSVAFTPDGAHVLAAGRDKRIHLWKLVSLESPAINPPLQARFAHESPVVALGLSADGRHVFSAAEDRSLKVWSIPELSLEHDYPRQADLVSVVVPLAADRAVVGRMDGSLEAVRLQVDPAAAVQGASAAVTPAPVAAPSAPVASEEREPNDDPLQAVAVPVAVTVRAAIGSPGDADCFRFAAKAGERIALEVVAARPQAASKTKLDSRLEVLDAAGKPVEQVVLQAVRDSWFTFRGKDSTQSNDFRVHNWREMELDEYLYANGEVVRLWLYPRGPDSGFIVYPGDGQRHCFFGSSPITHALGEPAWIVQSLPPGSRPTPNGLPVFPLFYENDDDPSRRFGTDSCVLFTAPADGEYVARVTDVRGFGGAGEGRDYGYELVVRPAAPGFEARVVTQNPSVGPGGCREIEFRTDRVDGFDGPIRLEIDGLPAGFTFHGPIEIEAGQFRARGVVSAAPDAATPAEDAGKGVTVRAVATIEGREVVKEVGGLGDIKLGPAPKLAARIVPAANSSVVEREGQPLEFTIRPGETITAKVRVDRHDFTDRVGFGSDGDADRNLPHGVFVDNIGLSGLLVVEGTDEREFFLTAAPMTRPGRRLFHLNTGADGGQASPPVWLHVLPAGSAPAATSPAAAGDRR
jgi:hypothetical protein